MSHPTRYCLQTALLAASLLSLIFVTKATADVFNMPSGQTSVQFVQVGDAGNAPDTRYSTLGYGAVSYNYSIGAFDITAAQYTAFLNAVAQTDTFGLYNQGMAGGFGSCHINQLGSQGSYTYTVDPDYVNKPVNFVNEGMRFANWLTNGQPDLGVEDNRTTENGSYFMNGATSDAVFPTITRTTTAKYVLPTENEWYKAAYYKGGSTNAGYWDYATQTNTPPSNLLTAFGSNNANYHSTTTGYSDPTHFLTDVGAFAESVSAYGTFDQTGDVDEWNEAGNGHIRGGSFNDNAPLDASFTLSVSPSANFDTGFRLVEVPEPTSLSLLIVGASSVILRVKRR